MAIAPITVGDTSARAKMNEAIAKANEVDSKASTSQLSAEASARQTAIAAEASARQTAIAAEAAARRADILALPLPMPVQHRPGDAPIDFGQSLPEGEAMALPLPSALLRYDDSGKVVRLAGDSIVAPRHLFAVEPGRRYLATFAFQRRVNSPDPDNDAVRCALAWYGQGKGRLPSPAQTVVQDVLGLTTGSGRQVVRAVVSRSAGVDVDVAAPAGARYVRPYVQTYGTLVQNDVEVINWVDITDAVAFAPDVSALDDRVAAVESLDAGDRLNILEAQVTAPNAYRVATIGDLEASMVPVTADTIEVLGYHEPGDGGGHHRVAVPVGDSLLDDRFSLDGRAWRVSSPQVGIRMLGAICRGATNDTAEFLAWFRFLSATRRPGFVPADCQVMIDPSEVTGLSGKIVVSCEGTIRNRLGDAATSILLHIDGTNCRVFWRGGTIDCNHSAFGGFIMQGGSLHDVELDRVHDIYGTPATGDSESGATLRDCVASRIHVQVVEDLVLGTAPHSSVPRSVTVDGLSTDCSATVGFLRNVHGAFVVFADRVTMKADLLQTGSDNGYYLNGDDLLVKSTRIIGMDEPVVVSGGTRTVVEDCDISDIPNALGIQNCGEMIYKNCRIDGRGANLIKTRVDNVSTDRLEIRDSFLFASTTFEAFNFAVGALKELVLKNNTIILEWNSGKFVANRFLHWLLGESFTIEDNTIIFVDGSGGSVPAGGYLFNLPTVSKLSTWRRNTILNRTGVNGANIRINGLKQQLVTFDQLFNHHSAGYATEENSGGVASAPRREVVGDVVPSNGVWNRGDIVWSRTPSAGGALGWICVAPGTPGTWKTFGTIAA